MDSHTLIQQEIERRKRERAERKRVWKQNMIRSGQAVAEEKKPECRQFETMTDKDQSRS